MKQNKYIFTTGQLLRELKYLHPYLRCSRYPIRVQQTKLLRIIKQNADTQYGKRYGFKNIKSITISDYQKNVPIVKEK